MNKIIKILKDNYKIVIGLILGIIISSISVYAVENIAMIDSEEVSYDNTESHGDYENVQNSIDELYERSGVSTTKWKDPILNGADPVLSKDGSDKGLIPITIEPDGTVKYANLYTEWYNYSEKRLANAVILVSSPSKEYTTGEKIDEKDIESYFVWIPRYKYKIWNTGEYEKSIAFTELGNIKEDTDSQYAIRHAFGNARVIEIEFESKDTGKQSGTTVDSWLTHPAFTLGNTELNGIWVGKFETGYNQDGENGQAFTADDWNTAGAEQNSESPKRIIIKPNVYSWRQTTVKNMFLSAYKYHREDYNSHMMKNTEWGAVAYLSHSSYGIGGEININNNKTHKTGYSSYNADQSTYPGTGSDGTDGKTQPWNTPTGFLASTTGNITGVYDMSGGAWEYVAGYRVNSHTNDKSGFEETDITTTYKDYIDQYDSTSNVTSYNKRILGDATGELGPFYTFKDSDSVERYHNSWYADDPHFVDSSYPWFRRGGHWDDGVLAGQFDFAWSAGDANAFGSFRIALSIS